MKKYYRLAEGESDVVWEISGDRVRFRVTPGGKWHLSCGTPYYMQQHIDAGRVVEIQKGELNP